MKPNHGTMGSYLGGSVGAERSLFAELFLDVIAENGKSQRRLVGRSFNHLGQAGRRHTRGVDFRALKSVLSG